MQGNFENYFSFTFQFFNILFLVVDVVYGGTFKTRNRILYPLVVQLVVFILMAIFVKVLCCESLEHNEPAKLFCIVVGTWS